MIILMIKMIRNFYGDCKLSYNSLVNLELEYLQKDNKTSFYT